MYYLNPLRHTSVDLKEIKSNKKSHELTKPMTLLHGVPYLMGVQTARQRASLRFLAAVPIARAAPAGTGSVSL